MEERYAFVLRIRLHRPASPQQPEQLRGTLESAGSSSPRYFSSLTELTDLLAASMRSPGSYAAPLPPYVWEDDAADG